MESNLDGTLSARDMADLARGAMSIVDSPRRALKFEVRNFLDHPGYLTNIAGRDDSYAFRELACSNLYGRTVLTATYRPDRFPASNGAGATEVLFGATQFLPVRHRDGDRDVVHGTASPNPDFIYDSADRFEALVVIDHDATVPTWAHTILLRQAVHRLSQAAATVGKVPLLALQAPVNVPRAEHWTHPASVAVRAVFAIRDSSANSRVTLSEFIARFCSDEGFGLMISDLRESAAPGNWVTIIETDPEKVKNTLANLGEEPAQPVSFTLPVTFVGPARVGSTHAAVAFLNRFRRLGIAGCSVTALEDVAMIHLQLVGSALQRMAPDGRADVHGETRPLDTLVAEVNTATTIQGKLDRLTEFLEKDSPESVNGAGDGDERAAQARLAAVASDYQVILGKALRPATLRNDGYRAIWFSWRHLGPTKDSLAPLTALVTALGAPGLFTTNDPGAPSPPDDMPWNFDYLIVREFPDRLLRGKGKLAVRLDDVAVGDDGVEKSQSRFCVAVENRWREVLRELGLVGTIDVVVAWRENWLSSGRSPQLDQR